MQLNKNILLIVLLVALVLGGTYWYNNMSAQASFDFDIGSDAEGFESNQQQQNLMHVATEEAPVGLRETPDGLSEVHEPADEEDKVEKPAEVKEGMTNPSPCQPRDSLSPEELLPQDYSSTWAKCNPTGAGNLDGKNFLDSGWHVGINTVGQTLRNPNLGLRSEPANPMVSVSPWLQSTIEPDTNRRYFEVGSC
jgi:hypothetical protein